MFHIGRRIVLVLVHSISWLTISVVFLFFQIGIVFFEKKSRKSHAKLTKVGKKLTCSSFTFIDLAWQLAPKNEQKSDVCVRENAAFSTFSLRERNSFFFSWWCPFFRILIIVETKRHKKAEQRFSIHCAMVVLKVQCAPMFSLYKWTISANRRTF